MKNYGRDTAARAAQPPRPMAGAPLRQGCQHCEPTLPLRASGLERLLPARKKKAAVVTGTLRSKEYMEEKKGRPHGGSRTGRTGQRKAGRSKRASAKLVRMYRRYHAWRAPFPLWARIVCDVLFWALSAAAAYVAIGSLCGAILIAAPLLGFLGLASSKEHDDGIDWSDHRMGGQPKNPGPKI